MTTSKEFIVKVDGQIVRRTTTEEPIQLAPKALDVLSNSIVREYKHIFRIKNPMFEMKNQPKELSVNLFLNNGFSYFTVWLPVVHIRAPHTMKKGDDSKDRILVPQFDASGKEPIITTHWVPPDDITVTLAIRSHGCLFDSAHLLVSDQEKRFYRLPMGNLYTDGKICTGDSHETEFTDGFSLVSYMFELFNNSQWNNDLVGGTDIEDSQSLFRFKLTKDSYTQLPSTKPLVECCKKVVPSVLNFIKI